MFLVSIKSLKGKFILFVAVIAAIGIVFTIFSDSEKSAVVSSAESALNYSAADEAQRMNFISQLGLQVNTEPTSVREIIIPEEFDETYTNYNELQKQAQLDLEPYKGCCVKKWTYTVTNYPGYEDNPAIRVNLLVYRNRIIGGDICSVEIDGFMKGLTKQE